MLPISDIPSSLREFAAQFRKVFKHPAQREHFETVLAGLLVAENTTIAGIHQTLVNDVSYKSLWHFMTESPWDHDSLRKERLDWTAQQLASSPDKLRVIAIDSTFVHHAGDDIFGVYWFWDARHEVG